MAKHADTISSEEPLDAGRPGGESQPTGIGVRATAMSAALTLVVATGVATAAYRGTSSDSEPTALIPASAFAVASADLSLPGGQSGSLETLLGHFPGLHLTGDGSIRDQVLRTIVHNADASIDYDSDVKPWLGDHVAVAGWANAGKPALEVVLQSKDDSSARKHLSDLVGSNGHVAVRDGYAVLGSSQAAVDEALAAAAKSSLDDSASYGDDIAALPDDEAITGWLDGPAAGQVLRGMPQGGPAGALAFSGLGMLGGPGIGGALFKGRVAVGVHVTDTIAELDVRNVGGTTTKSAPSTMLTTLPEGTIGALEFGDPGAVVDAVTPVVKFFGSFAGESGMTSCYGSAPAAPFPSAVPSESLRSLRRQLKAELPAGTPHRRQYIRVALRNYRKALAHARHNNGGGYASSGVFVPDTCTSQPSAPTDPFVAIEHAIGIRFPDDVKTVLGDRAVVAFGGLELAGVPDIAIRSHPGDLASAQSLANTLGSHLSASTPLSIDVSTAGDDLVLATTSNYGQQIAKAGGLDEQDQFESALAGLPDSVSVAGYVDLSRVWPLIGDSVPAGVQHLHAVGFWAANSGDVQSAQLRLVVG